MRWWYLRRALPWGALTGLCTAAALIAAVLHRWPEWALVLLPAMLGCCAAAAGFVFDEPAPAVVAVTPRGSTWRRTTRLTAAVLPLGAWAVLVLLQRDRLSLQLGWWWLVGAAGVLLVGGLAAVASRHDAGAPGAQLAAGAVLTALGTVVVTMFLDLTSVYPLGEFPSGARAFWLLVCAAGVVACAAALRPGVRR